VNYLGWRVPKASMPLGAVGGTTQQCITKVGNIRWLDGVESRLTSAVQKGLLWLSVLNRKMPRMIFKKCVIIMGKFMKRKEVPGNIRYMKNIIQYKRMSSSSNNRMTSMQNTQTCSIVDLDLITTMVALVDRKAIEITSNVIRGAGVTIPIRVYLVWSSGGHRNRRRLLVIGFQHRIAVWLVMLYIW
jgi:hypothetical protein